MTPHDLPALIAWYCAKNIPGGDGQAVRIWPDRSGNGHDLVIVDDRKDER